MSDRTDPKRQAELRPATLSGGWFRSLSGNEKRAFFSSGAGWGLDAFDYMIFPLTLTAIATSFALSKSQAGWIATTTLVVSALGGVLAGILADRIGRVRTLMITIAVYSVFTLLCGLAPNYPTLLVFRTLLGLGFGGEWAAGAILIAEVAQPRYRGRILGAVQSAWAVGWGLAVVAYTILFSLLPPGTAWRVMFWVGILPALLILYVRRDVNEPRVFVETRDSLASGHAPRAARTATIVQIFRKDLLKTTVFGALLATGVQGGYYSIFTWLPAYLKNARGLTVVGTGGYLAVVIVGSFVGYVLSGYINDWLGRRVTFALFSIVSGVLIVAYTQIPNGENSLLLALGFPLGFFASGIFSGFGSYLAELYPTRARGAGQGFCYNFGRALGAFFPAAIGYLSGSIGLGGAIAFGAFGYLIALITLLFLPETRGKQLVAVD
ncbi:MAG: MFS transporter [Sciscionella sp.]